MSARKMAFLFPGIGLFIFSLILMFSGAYFPEIAENPVFTGVGFVLFFASVGYMSMKALGLVVT